MHDMYPLNQSTDASDDAPEAMRAVQVALDRRDNGGAASTYLGPVTVAGPPLRGPGAQ